jgi:hypothetical protein
MRINKDEQGNHLPKHAEKHQSSTCDNRIKFYYYPDFLLSVRLNMH